MAATEALNLRVLPDLKAALKAEAEKRNISVNALCNEKLAS